MGAAAFLKAHPFCCFCGGSNAATRREHQPSRIIFPNKHRPAGMEYPSCARCNDQTRIAEAVLAFVCRVGGSMRPEAMPDTPTFKRAVKAVDRGFPDLLGRMNMGPRYVRVRGILQPAGAVNVNRPEIHISLCKVAAMGSLAAYYDFGRGVAPESSRIVTTWTHIANRETAPDMERLLNLMGMGESLEQGKWTTDEVFFRKKHDAESNLSTVAVYYESVALMAKLHKDHDYPDRSIWPPECSPSNPAESTGSSSSAVQE